MLQGAHIAMEWFAEFYRKYLNGILIILSTVFIMLVMVFVMEHYYFELFHQAKPEWDIADGID